MSTTIIINRAVPENRRFIPTTLQVEPHITTSEVASSLRSLLSGPLDDYLFQQESPAPDATPVWSVTAKLSYQERFHKERQILGALGNRLEAVENELKEAKKEVEGIRQKAEEQESCLATIETYNYLSQFLHNRWFSTLPEHIKERLMTGPSSNIPRALSSWWIVWHRIDPESYPFPLSLCRYGPLSNIVLDEVSLSKIGDLAEWTNCLVHNGQETSLGAAICQAWEFITPVDRELMLFCWAIRQEYHVERTGIAHPKLTLMDAATMVNVDLTGDLQWLHDRAITLMTEIFK